MFDSNVLILGYIVAFFSAFIVVVGGVSTWLMLSDLGERMADAGRRARAEPRGAVKAA